MTRVTHVHPLFLLVSALNKSLSCHVERNCYPIFTTPDVLYSLMSPHPRHRQGSSSLLKNGPREPTTVSPSPRIPPKLSYSYTSTHRTISREIARDTNRLHDTLTLRLHPLLRPSRPFSYTGHSYVEPRPYRRCVRTTERWNFSPQT